MNLKPTTEKFYDSVISDYKLVGTSFYGKLMLFTDSTRSGPTSKRRILITDPANSIPAGRVVTVGGRQFIVADPAYDQYKGVDIRTKYPVVPSDGVHTLRTISQVVNKQTGTADFQAMLYEVDLQSTEYDRFNRTLGLRMIHSSDVVVDEDSIIAIGNAVYRTISRSFIDGAGFGSVDVIDLGSSAIADITVVSRTSKNLVTEVTAGTTYTSTRCIRTLSSVYYDFASADRMKIEPGDYTYLFSKTVVVNPPKEGSTVDGRRVVAYKEDPSGVWEVRTRV